MITIYGAGAIGGLAGAYMARAGEDVLMVDKVAEHVDAMNHQGLQITGYREFTVPVRACLPQDLEGPLGLTFLAVKSQDTQAALDVLAPLVGPETVVVSLQNGMNPPTIAARLGADRVVATFINFGGNWLGPGLVEFGGEGGIYLGEIDGRVTGRLERIRELLRHLLPVHVTENVYGYLWSKQIECSLLFAHSISGETFSDAFANKRYQPLLIDLAGEGVAVAEAAGIQLENFDAFEPLRMHPRNEEERAEARAAMDRLSERFRGRVKVRSGFWRDLAVRRRPTEIDHITGWLVAEGEKLGLGLPLNGRMVAMVKEIERGERELGLHNLADLEDYRRGSGSSA